MRANGARHDAQAFVLIVIGGEPPSQALVDSLGQPEAVVAADSGADAALALGIRVDLLVGDEDSVSNAALSHANKIESYPRDKNSTDFELALDSAQRFGPKRLVVVGAGGKREDHFIGNLAAMAKPSEHLIESHNEFGVTGFVHDSWQAQTEPGTTVSILPIGGAAVGVTTSGLRWPLTNATLQPYEALGISNEASDQLVRVELATGVLAVIAPRIMG